MTDAEIKASLCDLHVVALTLFGEARGEWIEGKVFVGSVIRNRLRGQKRFGETYAQVCLKRAQFSCWFPAGGAANYQAVMTWARRLAGDDRDGRPKDATLEECVYVAEGIINGRLQDRAQGANHYLTTALWRTAPPAWAKGQRPVVVCGRHVGFKL